MAIACINCGFPMRENRCKVRCPRCGIFFDCSDGMLPLAEATPAEQGASTPPLAPPSARPVPPASGA
jgi:hypothetical protein